MKKIAFVKKKDFYGYFLHFVSQLRMFFWNACDITISCCFFATETVSEAQSVARVLIQPRDVRPSLTSSQFLWTEEKPYPDLQTILAVPLWKDESYHQLRERLRKPAPTVDIQEGGSFITMRTTADSAAPLSLELVCSDAVCPVLQRDGHGGRLVSAYVNVCARLVFGISLSVDLLSSPSQGTQETAQDPTGLLHGLSLDKELPFPPELTELAYSGVVIEVSERVCLCLQSMALAMVIACANGIRLVGNG